MGDGGLSSRGLSSRAVSAMSMSMSLDPTAPLLLGHALGSLAGTESSRHCLVGGSLSGTDSTNGHSISSNSSHTPTSNGSGDDAQVTSPARFPLRLVPASE